VGKVSKTQAACCDWRATGGKDLACLEFGREHFDAVAHVTFLDNEVMKSVFAGSLEPCPSSHGDFGVYGTDASNGRTLVFFDEIQECPRAAASSKQFCELRPDIPVVAAGSLLGVAMSRLSSQQEDAQRISWPVGKVDYLDMHPMTFKNLSKRWASCGFPSSSIGILLT
jgi:hypothetical protein